MVNVCGEKRMLNWLKIHVRLRHKIAIMCNVVIDIIYFFLMFCILRGRLPFLVSSSASVFAQIRNVIRRIPFMKSRRLRRYETYNHVFSFIDLQASLFTTTHVNLLMHKRCRHQHQLVFMYMCALLLDFSIPKTCKLWQQPRQILLQNAKICRYY